MKNKHTLRIYRGALSFALIKNLRLTFKVARQKENTLKRVCFFTSICVVLESKIASGSNFGAKNTKSIYFFVFMW